MIYTIFLYIRLQGEGDVGDVLRGGGAAGLRRFRHGLLGQAAAGRPLGGFTHRGSVH